MKLRVSFTVEVDEDCYPVAVDGDVSDTLNESMRDMIFDIDGVELIGPIRFNPV